MRRSTPTTVIPRRSLLWIGLGLVAAAPLLGEEMLLLWLGALAPRHSPATILGATLVQALAFAAGIAALRGSREAGPASIRAILGCTGALLGARLALHAFESATGIIEILCAGGAIALFLIAVRSAAALLRDALALKPRIPGIAGPLLSVAAITLAAAVLEATLAGISRLPPSAVKQTPAELAMPDALQRREARVPGARTAYWWQGHLHVADAEGLRRATPLPPRNPGVFRIAALGDSLTYGEGVAAEETWPAVLERELGREFRAEVLNLGVPAAQSEDVLRRAGRLLPLLEPDLVLYGVCLNDFLPSGRGQYRNNRAWSFTLPYGYHLEHGTRLGRLVVDGYDRLLMGLGVRADFYTDILRDFRDYQQRFARDAAALNALAASRGLPPVLAMVLNQAPAVTGVGWRIGQLAEQHLRAAGLAVVPADYIRVHAGRSLSVNRWEAHPNAEAHRIFAEAFLTAIRRDPRLASYRLDARALAPSTD